MKYGWLAKVSPTSTTLKVDVGRLKKTQAGCPGHVGANRALGPQVIAEAAFDVEGVGIGQSSQEGIAGHRSHDTLGAVVLAVGKRREDFLVVVESQAAGEPDPQRVAEVVAEGLFDEDRRLAVDRPDALIDRVAGQADARTHEERRRAYPLDALRVRGSNRGDDKEDSGGEQSS